MGSRPEKYINLQWKTEKENDELIQGRFKKYFCKEKEK